MPRTDAVLADARLVEAGGRLGRSVVKAAVAAARERARHADPAVPAERATALAGRLTGAGIDALGVARDADVAGGVPALAEVPG
ncbi:hypothetical protein GCM10012278_34100 [Nonomuraea glycinis]|uniref:L-seryl-tRNA selenium transferase N-terminal domain-containing protein n=1 Tax=Nonomuraea glycinis TaxID=2047744 RepID=A0A918A832_9ACTN|nr:hypothetical protein GCM10012278_34100 [Nonomuraea glycinis]